ncbi:MAG: sigma-54-dependent Fis family transcriptional regulator [Candidatus Eisenbacteria bacterium]|nr:sigma-54-dependent Fis family transcriptional regulator [Candidatus Eisenbacteria bacterium]
MSPSPDPPAEPPSDDDLELRLDALSAHYEVARALLGATEPRVVAERIVHSGMGLLGARSGAMLAFDGRDRFNVLLATLTEAPEASLRVPEAAREWIAAQGVFPLAGAASARALGRIRDRLAAEFDAAVGCAVADAAGLRALLLFGPPLLGGEYGEFDRLRLEAIAGLAALALRTPDGRVRRPREGAAGSSRARVIEALRQRHPALRSMIGDSAAMLETAQELVAAAGTRFPALLTGESGAGKEVAARALHAMSERAAAPFETLDCGSIPRELIESELFGHVRGAFTGAHRDHRGAFELAHRGTLFLDEIGDMPLQLQTRLLRVVQEGRIRRVGDEHPIDVDVRVVAATHRDLKTAVLENRFREDLFYRLNVFAIRIPPLRERLEDLAPLVLHFLGMHGDDLDVREWKVDGDVLGALEHHGFPGNLRELANLCSALAVRSRDDGRVALADLEHVWGRQHAGESFPWQGVDRESRESRGPLGPWVLEQARAARFNLIAAARDLKRRRSGNRPAPLTERAALAYYLTGEILRALADTEGDEHAAARRVALDPALVGRVEPRVRRVCEALRAAGGDPARLRRAFGKLPAEYHALLDPVARLVARD